LPRSHGNVFDRFLLICFQADATATPNKQMPLRLQTDATARGRKQMPLRLQADATAPISRRHCGLYSRSSSPRRMIPSGVRPPCRAALSAPACSLCPPSVATVKSQPHCLESHKSASTPPSSTPASFECSPVVGYIYSILRFRTIDVQIFSCIGCDYLSASFQTTSTMFIAPAIAPLRSTLWIPVLTPILARSDAEPHFQSTAALIAWPAILRPTLWLLALLADIWQAGYMELNCSVSSFAAVKSAVASVI